MKVLCLGNNTEDTDTRARHLSLLQNTAFHGIISELDGTIPESFAEGYYHSRSIKLCDYIPELEQFRSLIS